MYYYKKNDGSLFAGTRPPKNIEKFTEITEEEYETKIAELEALTDGNSEN